MVTLDEGGWAASAARIRRPPPELAAHVEHVFTIDFREADQRTWKILPDTCGHLLLSIADPGAGGAGAPRLVGARTRAVQTDVAGRQWTVGVRLRPGALPALLGDDAFLLTDRGASAGSVWGAAGDRLEARIRGAADPAQIRERILAFLAQRVAVAREPDWRATAYANAVDSARGGAGVAEAAARMGVSVRGLRASARRTLGLPPKRYARIHRLLSALNAAVGARAGRPGEGQASRPSWARVAARCGYADQSHLVRDFGDLLGETPTSFVGRGRRVPIRSRRPREADPTSRRGERGPSGR